MVQMFMSKQMPMDAWAPKEWLFMAKGFYLQMLREAVPITNLEEKKKSTTTAAAGDKGKPSAGLFRFGRATALALDDASAPKPLQCTAQATDPEAAPSAQPLPRAAHDATFEHDIVTDEVERWKRIEDYKIEEVTDDDGVVNEMALLFSLRASFPLHYCVFKQVVSHLCHEGNTEQLFSLSGALSDDNCKMHPDNLATWTSVGANMGTYKPPLKDIIKRYYKKFGNNAELSEEQQHDDLVTPSA